MLIIKINITAVYKIIKLTKRKIINGLAQSTT